MTDGFTPITQIVGAIGSGSPALKGVLRISHWLVTNVDDAVMPGLCQGLQDIVLQFEGNKVHGFAMGFVQGCFATFQ